MCTKAAIGSHPAHHLATARGARSEPGDPRPAADPRRGGATFARPLRGHRMPATRSAVLAVIAATLSACARKQAAPPAPVEVEVVPVVQRDVPIVGEWIGTLDGSVNADIRPKVEGYLLHQLYK